MSGQNNVILITVDCLRADHLGCYGYDRDTAPFISDLANRSVVFDNAFATGPVTPVSFPSILTSTYPFDFGGYHVLSSERTIVSEVLCENGVQTAGIHSNPYLSEHFGYNRGFNRFDSNTDEELSEVKAINTGPNSVFHSMKRKLKNSAIVGDVATRVYRRFSTQPVPYRQAEEVTDKAINYLDNSRNGSNFLWLHYMDVHSPLQPKDDIFALFSSDKSHDWRILNDIRSKQKGEEQVSDSELQLLIDAYDAAIRYVDNEIRRLFNYLGETRMLDDTTIIFTADHGEELNEHGRIGHEPELTEKLLHVPLLVSEPGIESQIKVDELVSLIDISPTVLDCFDIKCPDRYRGRPLQRFRRNCSGYNYILAEICHTSQESHPRGEYAEENAVIYCRGEKYKYIRDNRAGTESFGRIDSGGISPGTGTDVSADAKAKLQDHVDSHLSDLYRSGIKKGVDITQETAQRLSDLGYIE